MKMSKVSKKIKRSIYISKIMDSAFIYILPYISFPLVNRAIGNGSKVEISER